MATIYKYLNSYKLYSNQENPEQKGCVVTLQLSGDETGNLSITLPEDVTSHGDDYQVQKALEQHYRNLKPEQYQTEIVEQAKAQVDQATSTLKSFRDDLDKVASEALKKVQGKLEELVTQATESLDQRLQSVEHETTELKKVINANNLTKDQKQEIEQKYPNWQPSIQYSAGSVVNYDGKQYEILQDHTSQATWLPSETPSLYKELKSDKLADGTEVIKDWSQPTGAHDAYNTGDKVIYDGKVYESLIDSNTYSPSGYPGGWQEIK